MTCDADTRASIPARDQPTKAINTQLSRRMHAERPTLSATYACDLPSIDERYIPVSARIDHEARDVFSGHVPSASHSMVAKTEHPMWRMRKRCGRISGGAAGWRGWLGVPLVDLGLELMKVVEHRCRVW